MFSYIISFLFIYFLYIICKFYLKKNYHLTFKLKSTYIYAIKMVRTSIYTEIISSDLYFPLENQVHSQFNFLCSCYSSSDIEIHC